MKYQIGDRFLLGDIECVVSFVDRNDFGYLTTEYDGEDYNNRKTLIGLVFTKINPKGYDELGNKVVAVNKAKCGAV